jgi:hypothetical protein
MIKQQNLLATNSATAKTTKSSLYEAGPKCPGGSSPGNLVRSPPTLTP